MRMFSPPILQIQKKLLFSGKPDQNLVHGFHSDVLIIKEFPNLPDFFP